MSFVFTVMLRPPPSSTLFPYTTLFRSERQGHPGSREARVPPAGRCPRGSRRLRQALPPVPRRLGDRKSTRLNSSHQITSYAVFCLKKKKKRKRRGRSAACSHSIDSFCR